MHSFCTPLLSLTKFCNQVTFVGEGDSDYLAPVESRAFCTENGVASWRTCFGQLTIPTSYLETCIRRVYDPRSVDEAPSLVDAVDAWLLDGVLVAVTAYGGLA